MSRPSLQPPAWYADRRHASALRYWDGRRWTSRWRPVPGWAWLPAVAPVSAEPLPSSPLPAPAPPPGSPRPSRGATAVRRARRLALASAAALAAATVMGAVATFGRTARVARISDAAFVRSADSACASALDPLRRERPPRRRSPAQLAERIDRLASTLTGLASQLRTIPVKDANRLAVEQWLAAWDDYTGVGRELASSVRSGDGRASSLGSQANGIDLRIQVFARVNGLERCVF